MSVIQKALTQLQTDREKSEDTRQPIIIPLIHPGQTIEIETGYVIYRWTPEGFVNDDGKSGIIGLDVLSSKKKMLDTLANRDAIFLLSEINPSAAVFYTFFRNLLYIPEPAYLEQLGEFIPYIIFNKYKLIINNEIEMTENILNDLRKISNKETTQKLDKIFNEIKCISHNIYLSYFNGIEIITAIRDIRKTYSKYFDDNNTIFNTVKDISKEVSYPKYFFNNNYINSMAV